MDKFVLEFSSRATQNYFIHIFLNLLFIWGDSRLLNKFQ